MPIDLVYGVLREIANDSTRQQKLSVMAVCRAFRPLMQPSLYQDAHIAARDGGDAFRDVAEFFQERQRVAANVETIHLVAVSRDDRTKLWWRRGISPLDIIKVSTLDTPRMPRQTTD